MTGEPLDHASEAETSLKFGWQSYGDALARDSSAVCFAAAQAHATLALVEQQKRTADALESIWRELTNSPALGC